MLLVCVTILRIVHTIVYERISKMKASKVCDSISSNPFGAGIYL